MKVLEFWCPVDPWIFSNPSVGLRRSFWFHFGKFETWHLFFERLEKFFYEVEDTSFGSFYSCILCWNWTENPMYSFFFKKFQFIKSVCPGGWRWPTVHRGVFRSWLGTPLKFVRKTLKISKNYFWLGSHLNIDFSQVIFSKIFVTIFLYRFSQNCFLSLKIFLQKNLSSSGNKQKWSNWSCEHFHTFDWSTPSCRTTRFWHFWFFVENQNQDMAFWGPTYYIFPRRCMRWYEYLEFIFKHFWELLRRGKVDSHARRHLLMTLIIFKNQNPVKVTSKSGNRTKHYVRKVVSVFFRILMYIWYDPGHEGLWVLMSGVVVDLF